MSQVYVGNGSGGGGSGNVSGPGSSTNRAIATWNGTTGTALFDNPTTEISSSGAFTNTGQPAFVAYVSNTITNPTGDGTPYTIIFDSTLKNQGSGYNTSTGLFTAPVTGIYHFDTMICFSAIQSTSTTVVIQFQGSVYSGRILQFQGATTALVQGTTCYSGTFTIAMTANDTMSVLVNVGGVAKNVSIFGSGAPSGTATVFSGYLIC